MSDTPQAYPLAWPPGKTRTKAHARKRAAFKRVEYETRNSGETYQYTTRINKEITVAVALKRLQVELDRLNARLPVVSTNLEVRLDGLPRSGQCLPEDPGVAVYFRLSGDPVVLACDRYDRVGDNIVAIAKHIDASRAIERYGVGTLKEIFRGFTALPSAMAVDDWRALLDEPANLAAAEATYHEKIKTAHPDVGGTTAKAAALNAAIAKAREVLPGAR